MAPRKVKAKTGQIHKRTSLRKALTPTRKLTLTSAPVPTSALTPPLPLLDMLDQARISANTIQNVYENDPNNIAKVASNMASLGSAALPLVIDVLKFVELRDRRSPHDKDCDGIQVARCMPQVGKRSRFKRLRRCPTCSKLNRNGPAGYAELKRCLWWLQQCATQWSITYGHWDISLFL